MKGSGNGPDGPEDVDAAFAEIVADLEREGLGAGLPADLADPADPADLPDSPDFTARRDADTAEENGRKRRGTDRPGTREDPDGDAGEPAGKPGGTAWRGHDAAWDWSWSSDDEHYVPPEPPPLPRPRPVTVIALVLLAIGGLLLVAPGLLTLPVRVATPIALISLAVGIGLIVLRIRQGPPGTDRDDGAQL